MDSSAFRNLPVGGIVTFAIIGIVLTFILGIAAVAGLGWFIFHHIQIV